MSLTKWFSGIFKSSGGSQENGVCENGIEQLKCPLLHFYNLGLRKPQYSLL